MLTGDDAVELNFRALSIGFDPEELRFVPLFNEGLWAAFFKNIDLRGYNDDNPWCPTQTADFLIELWAGMTELQEYEGTSLNATFQWKQGARERCESWLCSNCKHDTRNPVEGDVVSPICFMEAGRYAAESMLCKNCFLFLQKQ